jgi:hypothetical protein
MRATTDIDDAILQELQQLQAQRGQFLGRLRSDLLARALAERRQGLPAAPASPWSARPMGARFDLSDTGALLDALDASRRPFRRTKPANTSKP